VCRVGRVRRSGSGKFVGGERRSQSANNKVSTVKVVGGVGGEE